MTRLVLTRRRLLLFAATALGSALPLREALAGPSDQGIGGTGFSLRPVEDESDRGIGGTGVIGTIRKFGSIIVNDLRITYPKDVAVRIDDRPASATDLKLGQVVRVIARRGPDGSLSTTAIDVTSEVVGRVEHVTPKTLTVLGQTVSTAELQRAGDWRVGDNVAVSGLRRNDATIVASLIEPRDATTSRVAGPVVQRTDGTLRIGALELSGLSATLIGQRAIVEGRQDGTMLAVTRSVDATSLLPKDVQKLSIEAYVERNGADLRLGSGFPLTRPASTDFPAGRSVRAIVTTSVALNGHLSVETLRSGGKQYRASGRKASKGSKAPDGTDERRPMDFGRDLGPTVPSGGDAGTIGGPQPAGGFFGSPGGENPGGRFGPRGFGGGGFGGPGGFGGGPGHR